MPPSVEPYRYAAGPLPEGLCVGATQYLPRGVPRTAYVERGYFEVWLPLLAPSRPLLASFLDGQLSFAAFARGYRAEMRQPAPRQVIRLLATLARRQRVNIGCYCADPSRCHRTLLVALIRSAVAELSPEAPPRRTFARPACSMPEIED